MMEAVVGRENMLAAYRRVRSNKGAAGADGMDVGELWEHCKAHWPQIKAKLLEDRYRPMPVLGIQIPKSSGGMRQLGIPTALDRLIQQALHQVLQPIFDPGFSEFSYGFRPGRGAHNAVRQAQRYAAEGQRWVVDMDLEKFFDNVNHDVLMSRVARKVKDKRVLRLIRRYLQAGLMMGGVASVRTQGTPQGGPLSPLLSNILLDELDKELERRGHRFCRYADDCNIYVQSKRAGERVLPSITRYLDQRLRLKVTTQTLGPKLRGWVNYFKLSQVKGIFEQLDGWIRRKLSLVDSQESVRIRNIDYHLVKFSDLDRAIKKESLTYMGSNEKYHFFRTYTKVKPYGILFYFATLKNEFTPQTEISIYENHDIDFSRDRVKF